MLENIKNSKAVGCLFIILAIVVILGMAWVGRGKISSSSSTKGYPTPTPLPAPDLTLTAALRSSSTTLVLAWNPNLESDLAGYWIFGGNESGQYSWTSDVGNVTTVSLTDVGNLSFFALKAYNTAEMFSPFSNEVFRPTGTPTPGPSFFKAINIRGGAETINGNAWTSYPGALATGFFSSGLSYSSSIAWTPPADLATSRMLNTGEWCPICDIDLRQTLPIGSYDIYLWTVENHQANFRSFNVNIEGDQVAAGIGRLPLNSWGRYGPYSVSVTDGTLDVNLQRVTGDGVINGIEIWASDPVPTPSPAPSPTASATATATATIAPPTPTATVAGPDLLLELIPMSVTVPRSTAYGSASYTVRTTRIGFNSSVMLTVSGLPSSIGAYFTSNPATSSSTLKLIVSPYTPAGTYTFTVSGSGSVVLTRTVTGTLIKSP